MTNEPLTVYSKPGCVQCTATYRALDAKGVRYRVVDLSTDAEALAHVKDLGLFQAPVVEGAGEPWSGFRPDRIDELVKARVGMSAVTFATVQTTLPTRDEEHTTLLRKVAHRDQELYDYGRKRSRLTSTVTLTGTELVTVIDTLTKEES